MAAFTPPAFPENVCQNDPVRGIFYLQEVLSVITPPYSLSVIWSLPLFSHSHAAFAPPCHRMPLCSGSVGAGFV